MLAELAAANAAFSVIKTAVINGQEIYDAGKELVNYFQCKEAIQKKAHGRGYRSDLEAFLAEEKLKAQEDELKNLMIWQGRPGMWQDWLNFQAQCKRDREQQRRIELAKQKAKQKLLLDGILITSVAIGLISVTFLFVYAIINY